MHSDEWILTVRDHCVRATNFVNENYVDRVTEFYIIFALCVVGIFGNVINVLVYSHRKFANSPISLVFKALAVTDFALSALYLFDISLNYFIPHVLKNGSYEQVSYGYWTTFLSRVIHFVLLWLTILLAYWRYEALAHPLQIRDRYNSSTGKKSILVVYVACIVASSPYFACIEVTSSPEACKVSAIEEALRDSYCLHQPFGRLFWMYLSVLFSLSAMILIVKSIQLVYLMKKTRETRKTLSMSTNGEKEVEMRRTNRMILVAVILFFLTDTLYIARLLTNTEILLLSIFDECFGHIKFFSLFLFINPSVNTLCYLTMSSQYRDVLKSSIVRTSSTVPIRDSFRYLIDVSA